MIFSRRIFLGSLAALSFAPMPSFALSQAQATKLIDQLSSDILKAINAGGSDAQRFKAFEKIFAKYADVPRIAQKALGPVWRDASSAQRNAYVSAFAGYMARFYGRRFREFVGSEITVTGAEEAPGGYLVDSLIKLQGSDPFDTQWHVISSGGRNKMYNMYIEGVSVLSDVRVQIGTMLDKRGGDIDALTAHLKTAG